MSVDNTDEEYNQGPVVSFEVPETSAPPQKEDKGFPWWIVIVAAVVLALLAGGIAWWIVSRNREPTTTLINFTEADAGMIVADAFPEEGISEVETIPKDNYCTDAKPVILAAGSYGVPDPVLSTASSGNLSRCNGVELVFRLEHPASNVTIEFFGANTPYELRAYDSGGSLVGSDSANSTPHNYSSPSTVTVSSEDGRIDYFEFGHQRALTMIQSIEITTGDRE
jgi:hypothetical protein